MLQQQQQAHEDAHVFSCIKMQPFFDDDDSAHLKFERLMVEGYNPEVSQKQAGGKSCTWQCTGCNSAFFPLISA